MTRELTHPRNDIHRRRHVRRALCALVVLVPLISGCLQEDSQDSETPNASVTVTEPAPDFAPPRVVTNKLLAVLQGGSVIVNASTLHAVDNIQSAAQVRYLLRSLPDTGEMSIDDTALALGDAFTQADIDVGRVSFRDSGGAVLAQHIIFDVDDGQGNALSNQKLEISIGAAISDLEARIDNGVIKLSWVNPDNPDLDGIIIRRREDGAYPTNEADGVLVIEASTATTSIDDVVSVSTSATPQMYYYSAFSRDSSGNYSGGTQAGVYCDIQRCVTIPDLRKLLHMRDPDDVERMRGELIRRVWGDDGLPLSTMPARVDDMLLNPPPAPLPLPPEAVQVKQLTVTLPFGLFSRVWLFSPATPNNRLVIYHSGHRGEWSPDLVGRLLHEGYYVMNVWMPMTGRNYWPTGPYTQHDQVAGLDRPMRLFMEPVTVGINYVMKQLPIKRIAMMGLSGGGWTTVVYAAIDKRIDASYPVAGSYPFYLRNQLGGSSIGDLEQINPDFYDGVSYLDLYVLGSEGRSQLQIYNEFDDCCYGGTYANTYSGYVSQASARLGGQFSAIVDSTVPAHVVSEEALEMIVDAEAAIP